MCAAVAGLLLLAAAAGCDGLRYVTHLAEGQLRISGETEAIEDVLASGRLSEDEAAKLRVAVAAREYAKNVIGLNAGNSYSRFYDTGGNPLVFNLSAARRDRLEPYIWVFPIVGSFPYLGFFDEAYLREVQQDLERDGYDTFVYAADAYSTLGVFEDPIRSPMLKRDVVSLVDTIIHEILHNTIWRPNDTEFNETLATFVGQQGAIEFFTSQYDPELGLAEYAALRFEDEAVINRFLIEIHDALAAYYAQPLDSASRIAGREAEFERLRRRFIEEIQPTLNFPENNAYYGAFPTNNAWVLALSRYNYDLDLMRRVYEEAGRSWPAALRVFADAAASDRPFQYLREWLGD
jgi:predicted aminopeptidase